MQLCIHAFQVRQRDPLTEDHLVQASDKVGVYESAMENGETEATSDELEIVQVFWVDTRCWIDLKGIVVRGRVLKQAVKRVEHLVREQEEEFTVKMNLSEMKNARIITEGAYRETPP